MLRRIAGLAGVSVVALIALAQAQSYAQRKVDIRAGIVIIDSAQSASKQPQNFTPHAWYNLDSDLTVKPAGLNIYNPRATTQVSQAVYNRWFALATDMGSTDVPVLNASLTKASAAYWEVRLSTVGDQQLSDYDVLLLSAYGYTNLSSVERDKLRKFVDHGGTLWVDMSSASNFTDVQVNTFPLPFQRFNSLGGGPLTDADVFNPVLGNPYALSIQNLEQMRLDTTSYAAPIDLTALGIGSYWEIESWLETDYSMHFTPVATRLGNPAVLVGKLGDGHIVVTTSMYAMALNRVATGPGVYSPNVEFDGRTPTFDRTSQLAAKFAINVLYLSAGYAQVGGGSNKPNSNAIDLAPPLLMKENIGDSNILRNQTPVLYKGLLVVSSNDRLYVYDANPKSDLDMDGNPDDGIQDSSLGQDYDLLWVSQPLGSQISSPTCAEIPSANVKDQIFVVDRNETVYAFDAFQLLNGTIQPNSAAAPLYTIAPPNAGSYNTSQPQPGPYAPTFHDGLLYIADNYVGGRIWVADPQSQQPVMTGAEAWFVGSTGGAATLPEPTGSPTVGYIPIQDNSGGYDRVLYFPGRPSGVPGPLGNCSITSLWLGVRGESPPPNSVTATGTQLQIVTRAAHQGVMIYHDATIGPGALANRALGVKLTVIDIATGDPWTNSLIKQYFDGTVSESAGILTFNLKAPLPVDAGGNLLESFRLDYSIDWAAKGSQQQYTTPTIRGQLWLPDDATLAAGAKRLIVGNIAMSPRGTIYCNVSTQTDSSNSLAGGSYYAFREDVGRGGFRMLSRYDLYPQHLITLNQAAPVTYDETLNDNDPVTSFMPAPMGNRFRIFTFIGAPSVRNGIVYVTALARKVNDPYASFGGIPYAILMAFKADPEAPEIKIGNVVDSFSLRQPDVTRSPKLGLGVFNPTVYNDQNQGQFQYDRNEGVIRFDNLMGSNKGAVVNAFSTSQPVIVRRSNQPDQLIDPGALGDKWSPLLWYAVMHGIEPTAGAMTTGGSVFMPGRSILPNISLLPNIVMSGMIEAWNGNLPTNDPFLVGDPVRPWNKQLYQVMFSSGAPNANPDLLWPQLTNLRDFADFIVRARQTKLGTSTTAYGAVGGESTLAAWGDRGVYAYSKADFIVADEGRLARFDAAGNPLMALGTASSTGALDTGSVGEIKPMIRPVRAYPVGENDVIVADPGANRIARLDLTGRELRSITGFKLDPTNIPEGFKASEALTLNSPRDVAYFTTYEVNRTQYWAHYLIADTGNRRLIDVVDKYLVNPAGQIIDVVVANGERQIGVLNWHSPTNYSGKDFDYNSISRVFVPNGSGGGSYFYAAGIGSAMPSRVDTGLDAPTGGVQPRESAAGNGGVVVFDTSNPNNNLIINQVMVPDIPQNAFWNFQTGSFNWPARPAHLKTLGNVYSVTTRAVVIPNVGTRIAIMFTDASGVYEMYEPTAGNGWVVRWMLPNEAYRALRRIQLNAPLADNPVDLRATYARRLDDGDVLVVNGYLGKTRGDVNIPQRDFNGEVIQLNGDFDTSGGANGAVGFDFNKPNLGFELPMIVFQLPPIQGARGLMLPVFADRR